MPKINGLTPRQDGFVRHYTTLGDSFFNATESAARAGYKGSRQTLRSVGHENLTKPYISAAIDNRLKELYKANNITTDRILQDIETARHLALFQGNVSAALKASELHGKYLAMWSERIEHVHTLEEVPMDQLDALAQVFLEKVYGIALPGNARADGSEGSSVSDPAGTRQTH